MAAVVQSSPSFSASATATATATATGRLPAVSLTSPRRSSLHVISNNGGASSSFLSISTKSSSGSSTITMATKFSNGRYIREDYLVKKLSAKEVQELVKGERTVPLIVDFYATWCGPCILMAQDLEMLAVEYESNALFVKVDTDDEYEFARDMQVRGLPTLYFISPDPNKDAIRTEGLVPKEMIKNIIDNEM